jgi:AAHS family benzoate transporter-like MFS transporter
MTQPHAVIAENPQKEARTANWVAFIICTALLFDGYDLVIYGTVLPGLLADPGQIGKFDMATAGLLGSWALIGVLVGSLVCGAVGDLDRKSVV